MQPEEQIASREIYDGRIIKVRVDDVLMRNGSQSVREVVGHADAVVICPIDYEGNVHLVRQFRYAAKQTLLELPAGLVEEGEDPDDCAQRELAEEIRLRIPNPPCTRGLLVLARLLHRVHVRLPRQRPRAAQVTAGRRRGHPSRNCASCPNTSAHTARRNPRRQKHSRPANGNLHHQRLTSYPLPFWGGFWRRQNPVCPVHRCWNPGVTQCHP